MYYTACQYSRNRLNCNTVNCMPPCINKYTFEIAIFLFSFEIVFLIISNYNIISNNCAIILCDNTMFNTVLVLFMNRLISQYINKII